MKKFLLITFTLLVSFGSWAETALYTSSGKKFEITDVEGAMSEIFDEAIKPRYINIFVHGRGKHPEKGLEVIPEIEKKHGVKVLMFHWPSWESALERPLADAVESGNDLNAFLLELNAYVRRHPIKMFGVKLSMLVHSMGNIVFRSMIENHYMGDFKWNLFSTLTLNAADLPMKRHDEWVSKIDFSKSVFITYNDDDVVLYGSEQLDRFNKDFEEFEGPRLGRNLGKYLKKNKVGRAPNAVYLDFSKLTFGGHRHYLVKDKKKNEVLKETFTSLLRGKKPRLDRKNGVYKFFKNIFFFKRP
ncbi:alpha/beta hydrolase [Halobacteriovorax sp. HLS]|uniref:alpha/beta hydrolase n=1 Tax=Halobacteriovorax sp. HLS TaxID=2234000 RepID=UPI000FDCA6B3|nr:alpha/beta hydrolase [Halobacteriovorax sp. HLS]